MWLFILCLQSPFTVILEPNKTKFVTYSMFSPSICQVVLAPDTLCCSFDYWVLSEVSRLLIHPHQDPLFVSLFTVFPSLYLRLLAFIPESLIPVYYSSSLAFWIVESAYVSYKTDNMQSCYSPFPGLYWSIVPCLVPTLASWMAYTLLRWQVRRSMIPVFFKLLTVYCDIHSQCL